MMFGPDAEPLAWDKDRSYTRERLQVFYLSNAATPLAVDKLTEVLPPLPYSEQGVCKKWDVGPHSDSDEHLCAWGLGLGDGF